jgi:hypothetical protein
MTDYFDKDKADMVPIFCKKHLKPGRVNFARRILNKSQNQQTEKFNPRSKKYIKQKLMKRK